APGSISGDESEFATGTVQACIPDGNNGLAVAIVPSGFSASKTICYGGVLVSGGCNYYGIGPGPVTVMFATNGYNYGTTDQSGTITITLNAPNTQGVQSLTVTAIGSPYEPPSQDPDGPCPTGNCNSAG